MNHKKFLNTVEPGYNRIKSNYQHVSVSDKCLAHFQTKNATQYIPHLFDKFDYYSMHAIPSNAGLHVLSASCSYTVVVSY